eukprot:TRINITY_DN1988_c0_g1_i13.p1 TRINITY_DN1988_c0_g1~~TRINITY_DN1988_c0_g1_i13.p1  ORF type:complete len:103 (+),score=37.80 TRINITY_DN1988_c0_g1_i13:108-416(+)
MCIRDRRRPPRSTRKESSAASDVYKRQVLEGIEGVRVAIGPGRLLLYLLQGLFHPARKVREMYWRVYNNMYIAAADGMVSAYPNLEDEGENKYRRSELELFL